MQDLLAYCFCPRLKGIGPEISHLSCIKYGFDSGKFILQHILTNLTGDHSTIPMTLGNKDTGNMLFKAVNQCF